MNENLQNSSIDDLRELAADLQIPGRSKVTRKDELVALILTHDKRTNLNRSDS